MAMSPPVGWVWAPDARSVDIELHGAHHPMAAGDDGWWCPPRALRPGEDYRFVVDGGAPRPDPRSGWQPEGVDGPSRVDDPGAHRWQDEGWGGIHLPSAVIYEVHIGTFTPAGTFTAAIERLDHLVELGVSAVELMPVVEFPGGHGWGYDGVDLYAPHHRYGGPDGLRALIDACHRRGLAVILDVVYNHLGPLGNHLAEFGPYFTDRYDTPWGAALNVDGAGSDEVRRFVIDNACRWVEEFHVDGLRLDATHAIVDNSPVHVVEELAAEVGHTARLAGRHVAVIAEDDRNDPRLLLPPTQGGRGLDGVWNDDVHHAIHVALTGEGDSYYGDFSGVPDLARALRNGFVYDGRRSPNRGKRVGRPLGSIGHDRLVACIQNHDQIGNRAQGDRLAAIAGTAAQRVGAGLLLTAPFVPLVFQGEEWAASTPFPYFCDHPDAELARAVREGRRREFAAFGWAPDEVPDPGDPATVASARLRWDERQREPHAAMLAWYRELLALRSATPELRDARIEPLVTHGADWIVAERGRVAVAATTRDRGARVAIGDRSAVLAATGDVELDGAGTATLGPRSFAVLGG
ncbi:MAG: malto-oligosyltrehalose trehalohydrolase [Acidimicrobiales bacterium]